MVYLAFGLAAFGTAYAVDGPTEWRGMWRAGDGRALTFSCAWFVAQAVLAAVFFLASSREGAAARTWIELSVGLAAGAGAAWAARAWPPLSHPGGASGARNKAYPGVERWRVRAAGKRVLLATCYAALAVFLYPYRAVTPTLRGRNAADHVGALAAVAFYFVLAYVDAWIEGGAAGRGGGGAAAARACLVAWVASLCAWIDMLVHALTVGAGARPGETVGALVVLGVGELVNVALTVAAPRW